MPGRPVAGIPAIELVSVIPEAAAAATAARVAAACDPAGADDILGATDDNE